MKRGIFLLFCIAIAASCSNHPPTGTLTPVEVWRGADDGLTRRLSYAVENRFRGAPGFALSRGKIPGTLVVKIPAQVIVIRRINSRAKIVFHVDFASAQGNRLGSTSGSCWDDALSDCASQIYRDASKVVRKSRS